MFAEYCNGQCPSGQKERPQKQRTFVPAPHGGHAICNGKLGIGVLCDVQHRKIVGDECVSQAAKCDGKKHELTVRQWACRAHQYRIIPCRTDKRQCAQENCQEQGHDQSKMSNLWNHTNTFKNYLAAGAAGAPGGVAVTAEAFAASPFFSASAASGGI